jgi:hypothetical protein
MLSKPTKAGIGPESSGPSSNLGKSLQNRPANPKSNSGAVAAKPFMETRCISGSRAVTALTLVTKRTSYEKSIGLGSGLEKKGVDVLRPTPSTARHPRAVQHRHQAGQRKRRIWERIFLTLHRIDLRWEGDLDSSNAPMGPF